MQQSVRIVIGCSLLVQLMGFLKMVLVARYFGASAELDGYYLALVLPGFLLGFVNGALQTGFVPIYVSLRAEGLVEQARALYSTLFWLLVGLLGGLTLVLSLNAAAIIELIAPGAVSTVQAAAIVGFRVLVFSLFLNALIDYFGFVLNAEGRFFAASTAPVLNILVATSILAAWPKWGLHNLVWGLLAGLLTQLIVLWWVLGRIGIKSGFCLNGSWGPLCRVFRLMAPALIGVAFANANLAVDQSMATMLGEGAVSTLSYASRLHNAIIQSFVIAVGAVLLPHFAGLVAKAKEAELHALLIKLFRFVLMGSMLLALLVGLVGSAVVSLLFEYGQFNVAVGLQVTEVWWWYTMGLLPTAWTIFLARVFQALHQPWAITHLALISMVANILLNLALMGPFGIVGLAMSTSLVYLLIAVLYHRRLIRHIRGRLLRGEARFIFGITIVALIIAITATAWNSALMQLASWIRVPLYSGLIILAAGLGFRTVAYIWPSIKPQTAFAR
ncbi:MAG: murein biosynthesis integral membrane protein MurJ [Candidatus Nitrosoglobus sp.]|jgi:putative peptidoglycan lipid II flippase